MVTTAALELRPIATALGAEVAGLDLGTDLDDATVAALRASFNEHQVLVFRDQNLTADQQMAFGLRFGELDTHPFVEGSPDHPEVLEIITEPTDRVNFGGGGTPTSPFSPSPISDRSSMPSSFLGWEATPFSRASELPMPP